MENASALIQAVTHNDSRELVELLDAGTDVNSSDSRGWTALHHAARHDKFAVAEILVKRGINVDAANNHNSTSLNLASEYGHDAIVELLINSGADVDFPDNDGDAPLHDAAHNDHEQISLRLILAGAKLSAKNNDGKTPIECARAKGFEELAKLLQTIKKDNLHKMLKLIGRNVLKLHANNSADATSETPTGQQIKEMLGEIAFFKSRCNFYEKKIIDMSVISRVQSSQISQLNQRMDSLTNKLCSTANTTSASGATDDGKGDDQSSDPKLVMDALNDQIKQLSSTVETLNKLNFENESKMELMSSKKTCEICFERPKSTAISCGHVYCKVCAFRLEECAFCKTHIQFRLKLYIE